MSLFSNFIDAVLYWRIVWERAVDMHSKLLKFQKVCKMTNGKHLVPSPLERYNIQVAFFACFSLVSTTHLTIVLLLIHCLSLLPLLCRTFVIAFYSFARNHLAGKHRAVCFTSIAFEDMRL